MAEKELAAKKVAIHGGEGREEEEARVVTAECAAWDERSCNKPGNPQRELMC